VDVPADVRQSPIYPLMLDQLDQVRTPIELYDLQDDPWEQRNRALDPALEEVRQDLARRLQTWMRETDDPLLRGPVASPYFASALGELTSS
jgi:N-sulfoglucosamine sulfohydrolase